MQRVNSTILDRALLLRAARHSFRKLSPVSLWRNPVMLVVEVGAALTTVLTAVGAARGGPFSFELQVSFWL